MVNLYLLLLSLIEHRFCTYLTKMNEDEQLQKDNIKLSLSQFTSQNRYLEYGLWSRYSPLSSIGQVGTIGIFDSNCYNLHNVLQLNTKNSNFLYYDCIDNDQQTIKKIVQFIDDNENQHDFILDINPKNYEDTWFYFGMSIWPMRQKSQLIIIQYPNIILFQSLDITFPYYDTDLTISFGGDLSLQSQIRVKTFNQNQKFSYFPGLMYLYPITFSQGVYREDQAQIDVLYVFAYYSRCQCFSFLISQLEDETLKFIQTLQMVTTTPNCDSFLLNGWIKSIEIHQKDSEFLYQFIKISANTENLLLTNNNLSPLQLFYRIQNDQQFIQIYTYSYYFPSVTLDFSTNPFLIKKEYELNQKISLWHFVSIKLQQTSLKIEFTFFYGENQYKIQDTISVNHFHNLKFKMTLGNLFSNSQNYINMRVVAVQLLPCLSLIFQSLCHENCLTCDGPTQNDCLSCDPESNRIYQSETKSCICPEEKFDQNFLCLDLGDLFFSLVQTQKQPQCEYGYFQFNEYSCVKCPLNPDSNTQFCLECLQNPQSWKSQSICKTQLNYNRQDSLIYQNVVDFYSTQYIYANEDLKFCYTCQQQNLLDSEQIYKDYLIMAMPQDYFCLKNKNKDSNLCFECNIDFCLVCETTFSGLTCIQCDSLTKLLNGICQNHYYQESSYCVSPYYKNSFKECVLCQIENCQYCFEYLKDDFSKNTLFKDFEQFDRNEFHSIGCALCQDGFQYDFILELCVYSQPKLSNCLSSFINLEGNEICTLSSLNTFDLSPQINNCKDKIKNCEQCIKSPSSVIRCIVCDDGFTTNISNGQCEICTIQFSKKCIQGDIYLYDGWVQLVQSFIMQFLNNQYFYPKPTVEYFITDYVISCVEGFKPTTTNKCAPQCSSDCLNCVELDIPPYGFQCLQCPLNYYNQPSRSTNYNVCLKCPKLCQICQVRTDDEIKLINPYFITTAQNIQYTHKCIQKTQINNVVIDSKTQIAKYLFNNQDNILNFDQQLYCDMIYLIISVNIPYYYFQSRINFEYCNQFGIDTIQITFIYFQSSVCRFGHPTTLENSLKQLIFSLNYLILNFKGSETTTNIFSDTFISRNFDEIQISEISFYIINNMYFEFQNDNPTRVIISNTLFYSDKNPTTFSIQNTFYNEIILKNLTFLDFNIFDSTLFNISGQYLKSKIHLYNIVISNCKFTNSTFISIFENSQDISIQNFSIIQSTFVNSTILNFHAKQTIDVFAIFKSITFFDIKTNGGSLITVQNLKEIILDDILLKHSVIFDSVIITTNCNLQIDSLYVVNNHFSYSNFLFSLNELFGNVIAYKCSNFYLLNNHLFDSIFLMITPYYKQDQKELSIALNDFILSNNNGINSINNQTFLFMIHCNILQLENIKISEQKSISFIYIYETQIVKIQSLDYKNEDDKFKIPLGLNCQSNFKIFQIIKIFGFQTIELKNIIIHQQFALDSSLFEFVSNIIYNPDQVERLFFQNLIFRENILLKQSLGKRLSLIQIYSEKFQNIIFKETSFQTNLFHQTVDDPSDTIAGLLYVNSQQSSIQISNISSNLNGITNSSCSFLFFIVNSLTIEGYEINSLNIFNENLLKNYILDTDFFKQKTFDELQLIIQKTLSIQTKGCACSATITKFQFSNGQFNKILSQTSSIFELKTQGQGLVTIEDLAIREVDVIYDSTFDLQGSIKIYSQNSQLNLNLINVEFINVLSKFSPAILSITPSLRRNKILLKNIYILNCFSLQNQIIKVEFSEQIKEYNFVGVQNVSIIQTEQQLINYFQKIGLISYKDLEKIMNDNAMINLVSCSLIINQLFVEGIFLSPIIKIIDSVELKIVNSKFVKIQIFYSFNLLEIIQIRYNQMKVIINDNEFRNILLYQPTNEIIMEQLQLNNIHIYDECSINKSIFDFQKFRMSIFEMVKLFLSSETQGTLLLIQTQSNQTIVNIQSLKIIENNCTFCDNGLMIIKIQQVQQLHLKEIYCIKNQIKHFGCLNVQNSNTYENLFTISNSIFAQNIGESGVGITATGVKVVIKENRIFNNSASNFAGGANLNISNSNFSICKTWIFQNYGNNCGGLKLNYDSQLDAKNFQNSKIIFNIANNLANNLVEAPTYLMLSINHQEMKFKSQITENITKIDLEILPYQIIQQGVRIYTNYLMIPSNQKIIDYKIYELRTQSFKFYIQDISLYFHNHFKEQVGNFQDQKCKIYQNILFYNDSLINSTQVFVIEFNNDFNKIDLGNLYFTLDPYMSLDLYQQIEVNCEFNNKKTLSYKFNSKTFFCQLGEFYTKSGCQICEANYGFYSVSYNATKCSIFDKTKFQNITSNTIQLLPGFWRPDFLSDNPEYCFKDTQFCLGGWQIGDTSCLNGYIGGLCEECDIYNIKGQGYFFKNTQNIGCLLCEESKTYIILFLFVTLLAIFSILITVRSIDKTNALFASLKLREKFGKIVFKLNQDHQSFLIKMFLNYLWIFSVIFTYNISFSINLNIVEQASNTSYFMANNLDCYLSDIQEINLVYIRIIATILFIFIQLILIFLMFYFIARISKTKFDHSFISTTGLYLYLSNYAAITKQFGSLIAKRNISNIAFVQGNVALQFYSESHQKWIFYFILPGLGLNGCLIPFLLFSILYIRRKQLDQIKIRKHICYLFNEYNENSYYWEQIKIWQKTIIIIIMTYFEADILLKTTLLGFSLLLYQFLAILIKPYIFSSLNKLDIETGQICSIAIFLAAAKSQSVQQNYSEASNILQIIIVFLCLLLIYLYASNILRVYIQKYKITILQMIYSFLKAIANQSKLTKYVEEVYDKQKNNREKLKQNYDKLKQHLMTTSKLTIIKQANSMFTPQQTQRMKMLSQESESLKLFTIPQSQI